MDREIGSIDFEVDFQMYRVTLIYGKPAGVFTHKRRHNGTRYLSELKTGSQTYHKVMREVRKIAVRGSVLAEELAEHQASL